MEKSFGYKVDQFAMIHSSADEIMRHAKAAEDSTISFIGYHLIQIIKSALHIRFVESLTIVPGAEEMTRPQLMALWDAAMDGREVWVEGQAVRIDHIDESIEFKNPEWWRATAEEIVKRVKKFAEEIKQHDLKNATAPY